MMLHLLKYTLFQPKSTPRSGPTLCFYTNRLEDARGWSVSVDATVSEWQFAFIYFNLQTFFHDNQTISPEDNKSV